MNHRSPPPLPTRKKLSGVQDFGLPLSSFFQEFGVHRRDMDSSADVQIWNNAAFDSGEHFQDFSASCGSLIFENGKASVDFGSGKENQDIGLENLIPPAAVSRKSSATPFKTVNTNEAVEKSRIRGVFRKDEQENVLLKRENVKEIRDEVKIDEEIEKVEYEISRLSTRLEALKMEKAEKSVKIVEQRGTVLQGKNDQKMFEEIPLMNTRKTAVRRGMSLGPVEILSAGRRGMSMGPSEIRAASIKSKQSKQEMITPLQSRRKSCFFKLQDIDEEKVLGKEKAKGSSVVTKVGVKAQVSSRQAVTTIASRKNLKKEDGALNTIQPKNLFKDSEKSVSAANKKLMKPGRVVASRYNQSASQSSEIRKRSLPENDKDGRCEKKRSLSVEKTRDNATDSRNLGTESRVKKRWEIPSEIIVHGSLEDEKSPPSIVAVADLLPRIRITRGMKDSPRDSGPAKRVAELIGRKPFFAHEEVDPSICQALCYAEEEDEI